MPSIKPLRTVLAVGVLATLAAVYTVGAEPAQRLTITVRLSVTIVGRGSVAIGPSRCGATCTIDIDRGRFVLLAAHPGSGYVFDRWSGLCAGTARRCGVFVTQPHRVVARFRPAVFTPPTKGKPLTPRRPVFNVAVSGVGTVVGAGGRIHCAAPGSSRGCSSEVRRGWVILAAQGSHFVGWYPPGACGSARQCRVQVVRSTVITATFGD